MLIRLLNGTHSAPIATLKIVPGEIIVMVLLVSPGSTKTFGIRHDKRIVKVPGAEGINSAIERRDPIGNMKYKSKQTNK